MMRKLLRWFPLLVLAAAGCQDKATPNVSPSPTTAVENTASRPAELPSPTMTTAPAIKAAVAANADVTFVRAVMANDGTWTFHVTVSHPDAGWEDYADGWDILLPDGTIIKPDDSSPFTRLLLHPHETEQPFTRSQSRIAIPAGVESVRVRAHDIVDGYGGKELVVDLTQDSGPDYEVVR